MGGDAARRAGGGPLTAPGGDERAALAALLAVWGRDWPAAQAHLVTLLLAGGRLGAADAIAEADVTGDPTNFPLQPGQPTWTVPASMLEATGWKCPGCGCCYAPATPECVRCNNPLREAKPAPTPVTFDRRTKDEVLRTVREKYGPKNPEETQS